MKLKEYFMIGIFLLSIVVWKWLESPMIAGLLLCVLLSMIMGHTIVSFIFMEHEKQDEI